MTEEQLKALLKMVKGDTSLQEKLKGAASPDAAVEIAKDAGFAITAITTFSFAITIIGPHTPVQANYYQGCNEECQEARRRSHCDAEGRCIPSGVEPGRIPNPKMPKIPDPTIPDPTIPDPEPPRPSDRPDDLLMDMIKNW